MVQLYPPSTYYRLTDACDATAWYIILSTPGARVYLLQASRLLDGATSLQPI